MKTRDIHSTMVLHEAISIFNYKVQVGFPLTVTEEGWEVLTARTYTSLILEIHAV